MVQSGAVVFGAFSCSRCEPAIDDFVWGETGIEARVGCLPSVDLRAGLRAANFSGRFQVLTTSYGSLFTVLRLRSLVFLIHLPHHTRLNESRSGTGRHG